MNSLIRYFRTMPPVALVGASNNAAKYGYKIFQDLRAKGYTVYPVNPQGYSIDGVPAFSSLEQLRGATEVELLIYVIPPEQALLSLGEAADLGFNKFWLQPGVADAYVVEFLDTGDFQYIVGADAVVESADLILA